MTTATILLTLIITIFTAAMMLALATGAALALALQPGQQRMAGAALAERVIDLVGRTGRTAAHAGQLLHVVEVEVADTPARDVPLRQQRLEAGQRFGQRMRAAPVQQEEVDAIQPETLLMLARRHGVTEAELTLLPAWREAPTLSAAERATLACCGTDGREQDWKSYALSLLAFNGAGFGLLFLILMAQGLLPLNPQQLPGLNWQLAFNTAVSFTTNTNWQSYGGEATMSYFSQMVGLTFHNFVSAAVGIGIAAALVRGIVRINNERHARDEQLLKLSQDDPLTGTFNRTRLIAALAEAIEEANRFRSSFAFMLVGIGPLGIGRGERVASIALRRLMMSVMAAGFTSRRIFCM